MPNIFHQSIEDILKAATPEQRLLWNYVFLRWGERVPVAQLYYVGGLAGHELNTYSANKIYIAYNLEFSPLITVSDANPISGTLYNELNAIHYVISDNNSYWDATAAAVRNYRQTPSVSDVWFSRIAGGNAAHVKFIGYRISI